YAAVTVGETACGVADRILRERCGANHHAIRRYASRLTPDSFCATAAERAMGDELPVRNHGECCGRPNAPRHGRLVTRMVDTRDPVARAIRPVVAEVCPASKAVAPDDQAIEHRTVILDDDRVHGAASALAWQRDADDRRCARDSRGPAVDFHPGVLEIREIETE